ncbi:GNAT family N-acetyltransferase [Rhizobium sp. BK376]|uniref:GNAT family N-acetyltransferase n=1 Tax=Rhizobium sp. BK376 TaxID=2512149 RepID=UPI001FDFB030|nr:GNAT family N-acetyltransferase [Rhizobium sp. BK376]
MQTPKLDIETMPVANAAPDGIAASARRAANDTLRIEVFDSMEPLESEWRALERDNLASLHQGYDWCSAWVATYNNPLAIVRGSFGARTAFILPLEIVRANMVRSAQFIAARRSNINTGLFSREFLEAAEGGLTASQRDAIAQALQGKADLVVLQNMPLGWRGRRSLLSHMPLVENQNHAFQLPFLSSFDETLKQLNAKRRRKKNRQQTRLLQDLGGFEHIAGGPVDEQHMLLDLFFQQKAVRFKEAGLPDVFQSPDAKAFLHRLIDSVRSDPSSVPLEMHAVRLKGTHEGHVPAVAAISRKGDHVICQFTSIDETVVPASSPGELLFWVMIEHFHKQDVALFDFGIGDQLYKRSWCPAETVQYDAILPISALGHVAAFAQRGVTRTKAAIKANPKIYGFIQRLRSQASHAPTAEPVDKD